MMTLLKKDGATIITIETLEPWLLEMRETGKDVRGFCEYIAYFVHEGILYSVRYWAVYDNTIPVSVTASLMCIGSSKFLFYRIQSF